MPGEGSGPGPGDDAKWGALVRHWPGYVLTVDGENRLTSLNRSTPQVDPSRDLGRDLLDFVAPEEHAALRADLDAARAGAAHVTRRASARHPDGTSRWYESRFIRLDDGGVMIVAHDVTAEEEARDTRRRVEEARRAEERLQILTHATQAFSEAGMAPDGLFPAVVREVAEALRCAAALSLLTDDGAHFTTAAAYASEPELQATFRAYFTAGGLRRVDAHPGMKHVVETGAPFYRPRIEQVGAALEAGAAPDVLRFAQGTRVTSALVVPLRARGRVLGALGLSRHGELAPPFDARDLALAQSLAEHAALALTAAKLLANSKREVAERERMAARLRLLAEASHEFSEATGDYDRLLAVIARRLGEAIGDLCSVGNVSEDGARLEQGVAYHRDPDVRAWAQDLMTGAAQRVGEGAAGRVAASGRPLFLPAIPTADYAASTLPRYRQIIERLQVGSVMIVPMQCRGRVVGVASLLRSGSESPYTEDDLRLLQNLADHAALAVTNARAHLAERAARAAAVAASEALRASEVAHRLLFDASPVALLVFDVETLGFVAVNDAATRQYGYTRDELLRMTLADLRVDGGRAAVRAVVDSLGEAEARGVVRHHRKDGSQFFAEYTSRALPFGGRRARFAVMSDVTARHDAEETRALLAAIVRSSNDAIVSKRLDGVITSWNAAAERLFGHSAAEAIGRPGTLTIPPELVAEERELLRRAESGRPVEHFETVRRRKDGSDVAVSISLAPILDASGKVVGVSKTARDLSAQRKAEAALRSTEEQLRQAQKMEAVGRLAGGIAHDFNNILSVILSYSELLLDDLPSADPKRGDLEEIRKAALRAADLTRQLLMFSRQQVIAPRVLDLNETLAAMDKMVRRILGEDVELVSTPAAGLGRVLADPSNVEQIIMNLVVNARDAMPTGGRLTIETGDVLLGDDDAREHPGATPGPHVMLAVTDTGVGMDAATQARIFEPFFSTKEVGKGTGLGLSTVFGIVEQSGGSVRVRSAPGEGTTFRVYFPRVEAALHAAGVSLAPASLRGTETVLLVEDQEQVRAVSNGILKRNGYRVVAARQADEALLLCEKYRGPIDLLLTDVVMPGMSGAELARRVERMRPGVKVLYMSGYTDDGVVRHGVLASEMAFLQKPFTPESLTRKVREVIDAPAADR